jgi:hypothetical protein
MKSKAIQTAESNKERKERHERLIQLRDIHSAKKRPNVNLENEKLLKSNKSSCESLIN